MSQQQFTIGFVVLLVLAVFVVGYSKLSQGSSGSPAPSATPDPFLFNQNQSNAPQNAQNQQSTQTSPPAPTPKGDISKVNKYSKYPGDLSPDKLTNKKAVIKTAKGTIDFEIYPEATKAASNFIFLANDHFYDNLTFHRVEAGFVIQGGDPKGDGTGGPGYQFPDEPVTKTYTKGTVAMANSGQNTNGSQFFIMLEDHNDLPPNYTIFGKVISGQDVVDKIVVGDIMQKVTIESLK